MDGIVEKDDDSDLRDSFLSENTYGCTSPLVYLVSFPVRCVELGIQVPGKAGDVFE